MKLDSYWLRKIGLFMHDPIDKTLGIPGHESRARAFVESLGATYPSKDEYQAADMLAAGMDRAALPGHNASDSSRSGSVDFRKHPALTHPFVDGRALHVTLPPDLDASTVLEEMVKLAEQDIGDFSDKRRVFYYLFFALRCRLAETNAAGLGYLWERLPADSRMPDHSIWTHNAMVSALGSSLKESAGSKPALAVFSITPVQGFIAQSRKLRDTWTASVLLSWLCFEGIKHVIENLGPDHILYPSLHNQPLVIDYLARKANLKQVAEETELDSSVASFPNKFVFLAPSESVAETCAGIERAVQQAWMDLSDGVAAFLARLAGSAKRENLQRIFKRQCSSLWELRWSSVDLVRVSQKKGLGDLLHPHGPLRKAMEVIERFDGQYGAQGNAALYPAAHALAQAALASSKVSSPHVRPDEPGEKCPLCGEREILNDCEAEDYQSLNRYRERVRSFWSRLGRLEDSELRHGPTGEVSERLCAVCAVKRFALRALEELPDHPLTSLSGDAQRFPSTTEMAAKRYVAKLEKEGILNPADSSGFVQLLHDREEDELSGPALQAVAEGKKKSINLSEKDKYYAILVMDGDNMGSLVNGETFTATYGSCVHPLLAEKLRSGQLSQSAMAKHINATRILSPSCHAAISESLGSFAQFCVAPIIKNCEGRLIYAGGDDVCAVLPMDRALEAARQIRATYTTRLLLSEGNQQSEPVGKWNTLSKRLLLLPGYFRGNEDRKSISISAAILIGHHKAPLKELLCEAQDLLKTVAKGHCHRDAVAIRLKKRSGGDRDFAVKWEARNAYADCTIIDSLLVAGKQVGVDHSISSRLAYGLSRIRPALDAIGHRKGADEDWKREKIRRLFETELSRSGIGGSTEEERTSVQATCDGKSGLREKASHLAGVCMREHGTWNADAVVMASFLSRSTGVV